MSFSESCWRPHSSYISDVASTCNKNCHPTILTIIMPIQFSNIFPTVFQCFYVSAVRLHVGEVTKTISTMLRHDALKRAHVHENTLGVTFGALRFETHFRLPTMCSETAMIRMLLGTHARRTTLCVTFCARGRSILLGLLDRFLGHLDHQDGPGTPERPRLVPVGPRPRPRMTSEPHFDTPATTSRPPGGYLP